jgi:small GTP-binding protein
VSNQILPLDWQIRFKIVVIGDGGIGKRTLCRAWVGKGFDKEYPYSTLGADFAAQNLILSHKETKQVLYKMNCQIWDLAGQPRFNNVRALYYRGAHGALCVFDVTNELSYLNLKKWIQAFWKFNMRGIVPVIIVGAKCDLRGNPAFPSQIPAKAGELYASVLSTLVHPSHGFKVHYIETSAKEDINVDEAFQLLIKEILSHFGFPDKF